MSQWHARQTRGAATHVRLGIAGACRRTAPVLGLAATRVGEICEVAVFFSDVTGFTAISEALSSYDVMYLLNRYFVQAGDIDTMRVLAELVL